MGNGGGRRGRTIRGQIVVVSSPSGGGKTTICRALMERTPDIVRLVTVTTRPPRPGEIDGVDYHFISPREFLARRKRGAFAEWAKVHEYYYATPRADLERQTRQGRDVLLSIDVQGGERVKEAYPEALMVFIMPPSRHVLRRRLEGRGTDAREVVDLRLANAEAEMRRAAFYEYVVVNRSVEESVDQLEAIVLAGRTTAGCPSSLGGPL